MFSLDYVNLVQILQDAQLAQTLGFAQHALLLKLFKLEDYLALLQQLTVRLLFQQTLQNVKLAMLGSS